MPLFVPLASALPRPSEWVHRATASLRGLPVLLRRWKYICPEVEKKLHDLAAQSGCGADELVQDALAGYLDEMGQTRDMLHSRYDDLKSGRVKPIDGEEAFARLKAKTEAQRNRPE